jgi:hypothetical protein
MLRIETDDKEKSIKGGKKEKRRDEENNVKEDMS